MGAPSCVIMCYSVIVSKNSSMFFYFWMNWNERNMWNQPQVVLYFSYFQVSEFCYFCLARYLLLGWFQRHGHVSSQENDPPQRSEFVILEQILICAEDILKSCTSCTSNCFPSCIENATSTSANPQASIFCRSCSMSISHLLVKPRMNPRDHEYTIPFADEIPHFPQISAVFWVMTMQYVAICAQKTLHMITNDHVVMTMHMLPSHNVAVKNFYLPEFFLSIPGGFPWDMIHDCQMLHEWFLLVQWSFQYIPMIQCFQWSYITLAEQMSQMSKSRKKKNGWNYHTLS